LYRRYRFLLRIVDIKCVGCSFIELRFDPANTLLRIGPESDKRGGRYFSGIKAFPPILLAAFRESSSFPES
jgi:hypothetical protein